MTCPPQLLMPNLLPDRDPEPLEPGYQNWSPRMGWGGKAVAWVLLVMIAAGLILMVAIALGLTS